MDKLKILVQNYASSKQRMAVADIHFLMYNKNLALNFRRKHIILTLSTSGGAVV